jgi:hypothetical protein
MTVLLDTGTDLGCPGFATAAGVDPADFSMINARTSCSVSSAFREIVIKSSLGRNDFRVGSGRTQDRRNHLGHV